jgi:immune inhibitor A
VTKRLHRGARALSFASAGLLTAGFFAAAPAASAAPAPSPADSAVATLADRGEAGGGHVPTHPLSVARKQGALKDSVIQRQLKGDKSATGKVVKFGKGQYVELQREATDPVFVIIVEFGDAQHPNPIFQGPPPDGSATDVTGPLHNEIPQPDRSVDNSTLWKADYNREHYVDMYFNRMANYYKAQSSNRYSVTGDVHGWVKVPFNEALYGRNYCGGIVCPTSKALARDAMAVWVDQQLKSGLTMSDVQAELKKYDVWDRYDLDGDGNFNEPDGYIDHMQIVHAGGDEAAGDPHQGTDAIWSHRWYANLQAGGPGGLAGVQIGANGGLVSSSMVPNNPTGVWLGDYTIQPENGGLGVFAHEYGHDLGLPDLYDTSGNTGGAENSTAFWTLMSSGANIGSGSPDGIGDAPTDLSAWELLTLGWLGPQGSKGPFYEVVKPGEKKNVKLGPNVPATKSPQAIFTVLPDKVVDRNLGAGAEAGDFFWATGKADTTSTMTASVTGATVTAKVRYDIEVDYDYARLQAQVGGVWVNVSTNLSTTSDPNGNNPDKTGITGTSAGYATGAWVDLTATLPSGTTAVRFAYTNDPAEFGDGFGVDAVKVGGTPVADSAWSLDGFQLAVNGMVKDAFFNAYVAENRQYDGYDASLKSAYNFGFLDSKPDWVENFPYQNGLLIWYWNEQYADNNVGDHPGGGLLLPVDAHPSFHHYADGTLMRQRLLSYDSTFGTEATDAITVHKNSQPSTIPSQPAVNVFDDTRDWWFDCDADACTGSHQGRYQPGWTGVDVPKTGTTITVNGATTNSHLNVTVSAK